MERLRECHGFVQADDEAEQELDRERLK